jgi:hypothetical protein
MTLASAQCDILQQFPPTSQRACSFLAPTLNIKSYPHSAAHPPTLDPKVKRRGEESVKGSASGESPSTNVSLHSTAEQWSPALSGL